MRFSVITISFNQVRFLREAMDSVLSQNGVEVEYIVVDAGSTDGSRELIAEYAHRLRAAVFEPDDGPADGLNKGFALATGEFVTYLNADDRLLPGALAEAARCLSARPDVGVLYGHGFLIDAEGKRLRRIFSDSYDVRRAPFDACVVVQPSTFFRRSVLKAAPFCAGNRIAWDAELLIDLSLEGVKFERVEFFFSDNRIYPGTITASRQKLAERRGEYAARMVRKVFGRPPRASDRLRWLTYRLLKHLDNPRAFFERLLYGWPNWT